MKSFTRWVLGLGVAIVVVTLNNVSHYAEPPAVRDALYFMGMGAGVLFSIGWIAFENIRSIKTHKQIEQFEDLCAILAVLGLLLFFYSDGKTIFSAPRIVALILLEVVVSAFICQVVEEKPATDHQ